MSSIDDVPVLSGNILMCLLVTAEWKLAPIGPLAHWPRCCMYADQQMFGMGGGEGNANFLSIVLTTSPMRSSHLYSYM